MRGEQAREPEEGVDREEGGGDELIADLWARSGRGQARAEGGGGKRGLAGGRGEPSPLWRQREGSERRRWQLVCPAGRQQLRVELETARAYSQLDA